MKNIFGAFLPLFLFLLFTMVLFFYLKNDNPDSTVSSNRVKDIFKEVRVKRAKDEPIYEKSPKLEVTNVRWHQHDGFERIVFDINGDLEGTFEMGTDVNDERNLYGKFLGYSSFASTVPSFASSSIVKDMEVFAEDYGYSFKLRLHRPTEYKVFALKDPSRVVIDLY